MTGVSGAALKSDLVDDLLQFSIEGGHADLLKTFSSPSSIQKSTPKQKKQQVNEWRIPFSTSRCPYMRLISTKGLHIDINLPWEV